MNRIGVIFLICLALTACRRDVEWTFTPEGFRENENITVGGSTRSYDLFVPHGQQNSPVIFLLHGHGGSKEQVVGRNGQPGAYWRWLSIAMEHDLILIIPNGSIGPDKKRGWNDCRINSKTPDTDDIAFMQALLDRVKADFDIDTTRVYVNGTSNGGFMAQRMAQEMPEQLAAIAVVIASLPDVSKCDSSTVPLSVLYMNGTEDKLVPYAGGELIDDRGSVYSTDATIAYWVARNGTDTQPETTDFADEDDSDKSTAHRALYRNGLLGTEVVLYRLQGAGHAEPSRIARYGAGYRRIAGGQNYDIEMADEVWEFFHDKRR